MGKLKFESKGLSDVRINGDGSEVELTFTSIDGKILSLRIPAWDVENLGRQLLQMSRTTKIKRNVPRPPDAATLSMAAPPPLFMTANLQGVIYPATGALDLQIQDVLNHEIQVSLLPDHVKFLLELILKLQHHDNDLTSH